MQVKNRTPEQKQTGVVYEIPCKDYSEVYVGGTKRTQSSSETRRPQEWYCSSCSKDQPLHQLGRRHSPKKSRRVLAEENCGSHPDQESHPEHEPGQ